MKFAIQNRKSLNPNKPNRFTITEGREVVFPGFEEFRFFTHPPYPGDEELGSVVISEVTTGALISIGWNYDDVYNEAFNTLQYKGHKTLKERLDYYANLLAKKKKLHQT